MNVLFVLFSLEQSMKNGIKQEKKNLLKRFHYQIQVQQTDLHSL